MGGFTGSDPVIDAAGLAEMVAKGELRYVLYGGNQGGKQDVTRWLESSCTVVPEFSRGGERPSGQQRPAKDQPMVLYQCW
jgi:hypothetical protein